MSGAERPRDNAKHPEAIEDAYSVEYLKECAGGTAREERLAELRRRIRVGAYRVDAETVADELIRRGDLGSES